MLIAAGVLAWLLGPSETVVQVSLTLGLGLVFGATYSERGALKQLVQSRAFLHGSGSTLVVILAGMIAVMSFLIADRYDQSVDLTSDARHTLAQQTLSVLEDLNEPIKVIAFYENDTAEQDAFRAMIRRFQDHSSRIEVEFVDPLRQPLMANQYEITSDYGVVILEAGDKNRRLSGLPLEKELAKALMLLFTDAEHEVCWSMGHGEPSPDDSQSDDGLGGIVVQLESLNYTVRKSYVLTEGIEAACEILVIARPLIDWLPYELEALAAYLAGGGQVFAALEPGMSDSLAKEMARYGVLLADDVIVDVNPKNQLMGVNDSSYVVLTHDDVLAHPITKDLSAALVLGIARSVTPSEDTPGVSVKRILETSEEAWAETAIEDFPNVEADEDELVGSVSVMVAVTIDDPETLKVAGSQQVNNRSEDIRRRLFDWFGAQFGRDIESLNQQTLLREELGAGDKDIEASLQAVEQLFGKSLLEETVVADYKTIGDIIQVVVGSELDVLLSEESKGLAVPANLQVESGGRLVVIGDADFATNRLLEFGNNQDLFLNTIAWLAKEERQIGERPTEGDKIALTGLGEGLICLVSLFFVPGGAILVAILLLMRRRYL
jgi:ABC-type uncharacterized transport system involved in gliding motility auxiliary subunit